MPRVRSAGACLAFLLGVAQALFPPPLQAQAPGPHGAGNRPRPIADAFVRDAVTYDALVEHAAVQPYVPDELVVAISLDIPRREVAARVRILDWPRFFGSNGVRLIAPLMAVEREAPRSVALVHLSLPSGLDPFAAMRALRGNADVLWASPNFYHAGDPRDLVPNDPSYGSQYHHPLMHNQQAWDITLGSPSIKIAITDDGMELTHADLAPNLWVNPGEVPSNGVDDDGNGYVDDVNGWDFVANNNNPNPASLSDDHGTRVAGIAAARTNNAVGVAGVSGQSIIMPLQWVSTGSAWTSTIINAAFRYAADNGARIVNSSYNFDNWVGNAVVTAAMQYVHDAGVLIFCSAGNDNVGNPVRQAFTQPLFVASTTSTDAKSVSSNYGVGVDIAAPGDAIPTTEPANGYVQASGTSISSPNAAGAAALLWSANPTWNSYMVACALLAGADDINAQNPSYVGLLGSGRVNTWAALNNSPVAPKVRYVTEIPAEGGDVASIGFTGFKVAFGQVMDPATANDMANYQLLGAGPNDAFGDIDDVLQPLTMPLPYMLGANELRLDIATAPLPCGTYRLTLASGGLRNPFSTPLDGDADGQLGGNFVRTFHVTGDHYLDSDQDGFGAGPAVTGCPAPAGYVTVSGDCDDSRPDAYPGAAEFCNGADDDCDGVVDFPTVYPSTNVPVTIASTGTPTVTSTLNVTGLAGWLTAVSVKDVLLHHSNVGDLRATLTSPGGTVVVLFDRPGVPATSLGCSQNHILATFDDTAALPYAQFEATCAPSGASTPPPHAISGTYAPIEQLGDMMGQDPNGTWTLTVQDLRSGAGGSLEGWSLELVTSDTYTTYHADLDGDGYGDPASSLSLSCVPGAGYVLDDTDCNDEAPGIHPGASEACDGVDNDCNGVIDGVEVCGVGVDDRRLPEAFALEQNHPNPFRGKTTFQMALPADSRVTLEVFDIGGRRVAELVNGHRAAGVHTVEFDASGLGGGLYFYRMRAAGDDGRSHAQIRRFLLVK